MYKLKLKDYLFIALTFLVLSVLFFPEIVLRLSDYFKEKVKAIFITKKRKAKTEIKNRITYVSTKKTRTIQ